MPTFKETAIAKFIVTARERIKNLQNRTDAMYNQLDKDGGITQKFYDRGQIDILKEMMPMLEETIKSIPEPNKYEIAEWISVEERLPEEKIEVFLYNSEFCVRGVGYLYKGEWIHKYFSKYGVTHWMKIPKPPEEKSSNK